MKSFLQHEIIWLNIHFYPSVFIFILTFWLNFLLESINLLLFINTYNYWFFLLNKYINFSSFENFLYCEKKNINNPTFVFWIKKNYFIKWRGEPSKFLFLFASLFFFLGLGHSNFFFSNFKYFWIIIYKKNHNIFLFFNSLIYF